MDSSGTIWNLLKELNESIWQDRTATADLKRCDRHIHRHIDITHTHRHIDITHTHTDTSTSHRHTNTQTHVLSGSIRN